MALAGRNRRPITAAAQRIGFSREAADRIKEEPWQDRAWQVYEVEGSIYFMTRYRAAVARKIDYFTGIVQSPGDDPNRDATYDDEGELLSLGQGAKVLEAEGGPELIRRVVSELMVHWDVAGEAFLVRFDVDPLWRVLSTKELKKQKGSGFSWDQAPTDMGGIDPENVYRVWKPHPRNHWQADSPTKHVLEDAEELILLRRELKARSNSRMSAGILFLPDAIDMSPFSQDEEGTEDDIARWLTDAMALAVSDPGSTRSLAPLVMTMNRDDIAAVKWQTFERNWDVNLEHRDALLRSIATGLDVPPEILTGMADLNHWSAWLVSEQAVSQHVAPTVDDILDSLTVNWFRPLLEASAVDPDAYVLWRDLSPATVPPDQSEVAFKAFELGVISDVATRRVINMDEEDAPEIVEGQTVMDADELLKRINALGTLRRAGADWESANAAVGLPPIELIPGLLPITVRAEGVVTNEEAVVSAVDPAIIAAVLQALEEGGPPLASAAVTAATRRRIVATELADIDAEILAWVVQEADLEIDRILKGVGIQAATDPLDESLLTRFGQRVEAQIAKAQERARGWVERLTGRRVSDEGESEARSAGLQVILAGVLEAVRRRLFTPQGGPDPIDTGKIADILPPTTAIREGLSLAGGGPAVYEDGHTSELIGNGQHIQDELRQDGFVPELMVWRVGAPSHPFDPHQRLGGTEFDSWDSPKLSITLDGQWISGSHYRPGDHKGCRCTTEMVLTQEVPAEDDRLAQADLRATNEERLEKYRRNPRPGIDDNLEIVAAAKDKFEHIMSRERAISRFLDPVSRTTDGRFQHYGERVKFESSIRDKIWREMQEDPSLSVLEAAGNVTDGNRYTLMWEPDDAFRVRHQQTVDAFNDSGWDTIADKNAWAPGDDYDGMNYKFRNGDDIVEIQFHTPTSAVIKDQSHLLYSEVRIMPPGPEKTQLLRQIRALWNTDRLHVPPGMESVGTQTWYDLT